MVYLTPELKEKLYGEKQQSTRQHKYNASKKVVDGIKFDSKNEARRYSELKLALKAGAIKKLELQPEFVLQEGFNFHGKKIRAIKYKADFKYINQDGHEIIEDVKGLPTPVYLLKKKMLFFRYPEINFREIK